MIYSLAVRSPGTTGRPPMTLCSHWSGRRSPRLGSPAVRPPGGGLWRGPVLDASAAGASRVRGRADDTGGSGWRMLPTWIWRALGIRARAPAGSGACRCIGGPGRCWPRAALALLLRSKVRTLHGAGTALAFTGSEALRTPGLPDNAAPMQPPSPTSCTPRLTSSTPCWFLGSLPVAPRWIRAWAHAPSGARRCRWSCSRAPWLAFPATHDAGSQWVATPRSLICRSSRSRCRCLANPSNGVASMPPL